MVAMEAGSGAHYWARELVKMGPDGLIQRIQLSPGQRGNLLGVALT